ncbi:PWWP domain-containing DNA repair factor 3A [Rhinophrynus dorsalis]
MSAPGYVLCKWRGRFWPAKVVPKASPQSKDSMMDVQILCLDELINVKCTNTKPLEKAEVEIIATKLASKSKGSDTPIEELTYRKALRIALDVLSQASSRESSAHLKTDELNDPIAKTKENLHFKAPSPSQNGVSVKAKMSNGRKGHQKSSRTTIEEKRTPKKKRARPDVKTAKKQDDVHTASNTRGWTVLHKLEESETVSPAESSCNELNLLQRKDNGPIRKKRARDLSTDSSKEDDRTKFPYGKQSVLSQSDIPAVDNKSRNAGVSKEKLINVSAKNCSVEQVCAVNMEGETKTSHLPVKKGTGKLKKRVERTVLRKDPQARMKDVRSTILNSPTESSESDTEKVAVQTASKLPAFEEDRGLTSDLSMELSSPNNNIRTPTWPMEDPEEEEELPSVLLQQGPASIEPGMFVWCKFQKYPYWPSVVKAVKKKDRKASVLFVEKSLSDPSLKKKGFSVALRTLKPYDCPEKKQLLAEAREDYGSSIDWCDSIISDYRIRMGCGSFSGSFTEYCIADISYPVRRELGREKSQMMFPTVDTAAEEDSATEVTPSKAQANKKVLPDRERAARDRANERLVEFIAKSKQAEGHLMDIIEGKKRSHWLKDFLASNRSITCLETYLEDEEQVELVVGYLQTLCERMGSTAKKLMNKDQTRFILDVLLPEAVIFAISAIDEIHYEKAEKKYLEGPSISKRERSIFEEQILEKKKLRELEKICS